MPDFAYDGRDFDVAGANIVVKYRNSSGVLITRTGEAAILADTDLHAKVGMAAETVEAIKTAYTGGASAPEDTLGGAYKTTWPSGTSLAYVSTDINSNLFLDQGLSGP